MKNNRLTPLILSAVIALSALCGTARAQYTATSLHPAGFNHSEVQFVSGNHQYGSAYGSDYIQHAFAWTGDAASAADLTPPGFTESELIAVSATGQFGTARSYQRTSAYIWHGTAASGVDLTPPGGTGSGLSVAANGHQYGYALVPTAFGFQRHAYAWSGTPASGQDLHPNGYSDSYIEFATDTAQYGYAYSNLDGSKHPFAWQGTAASAVNLMPAGYRDAVISGISGAFQYGYAYPPDGGVHAFVWQGTAASGVDLHPEGAIGSFAFGVSGRYQYGSVTPGPGMGPHAFTWQGSAASGEDLTPDSAWYASIVLADGDYQYGVAYDLNVGYQHAFAWHGTKASGEDLTPNGFVGSRATVGGDGTLYGDAAIGGPGIGGLGHAFKWQRTPLGHIATDLHPSGAPADFTLSYIEAVSGAVQFGYLLTSDASIASACIWRGTAASAVNLGAFRSNDIPAEYTGSLVNLQDANGNFYGGFYIPFSSEYTQAVAWKIDTVTLTTAFPASVSAGAGSVSVTLTGANFTPDAQVNWNGVTPLATTYLSPTQLRVLLPAALTATAGSSTLTVTLPSKHINSAPLPFAVIGTPRLAVTAATARRLLNGQLYVEFTITNTGTDVARNLQLTSARLTGTGGATLMYTPALSVPNLAPNQSYIAAFIPGGVVTPATRQLQINGSMAGGSFQIAKSIVTP